MGGFGTCILLQERQIPILFIQGLLFAWSAFVKEKHKIQIILILFGTLVLILASTGLLPFPNILFWL